MSARPQLPHSSAATRVGLIVIGLVGLTVLAGCRQIPLPNFQGAPPPPPKAAGSAVGASWELVAQPLGRSALVSAATESSAQWRAAVRLIEVPTQDALPAPERPTWIFAPGGGEPLEPAPRFTAGLGSGWLSEPLALDQQTVRAERDVPLAQGCSWSFAPSAPKSRGFEVLLWLEDDGSPAAAVAVRDSVTALKIEESQASAVGALDPSLWEARSGVEYAPLSAAQDRRVLWCRVPTIGAGALVLEISLREASTTGPAGLAHARELALRRVEVEATKRGERPATLLELASSRPEQRRALLVELARAGGRPVLVDLVLLAPDDALARWSTAAFAGAEGNSPADAWRVEQTALTDCARTYDADQLDTGLSAVLIIHLGAVGAEPTLLGDLVARATGPDDFARAVEVEHSLLLEDPRTGVRVRALRWLADRNLAPSGFDALGDRDARRAALEAWRATSEGVTP